MDSGIAVVITNQVVAQVDGGASMFNSNPHKPIGGVLSFMRYPDIRISLHMHQQQGCLFVKAGETNVFARFLAVRGCQRVMPSSRSILMALVILERIYPRRREMKNSWIRI
jgi:hypothetical protein